MSHISADTHSHSHAGLITVLVGMTIAAFLACAWKLTPAADYVSPQMIAQLFQDIQASDWAIPCMLGMYVLGSMIFFPLTILIIATSLVFPPAEACGIALSGAILSAYCGYAVGCYSGIQPQQFLAGRAADIFEHYFKHAGIMSIALVRMVPLLPLGLIDVAMGMARIPLFTYSIATLIGLVPIVCVLSLLGSSLDSLWHKHNIHTLLYIGLGIICWLALALFSHYMFRSMENKRFQHTHSVAKKII